jgi:hypothetical protein
VFSFPPPEYLPCPDCGESVHREDEEHVCDDERLLAYLLLTLHDEVARLECEIQAWLASPEGQLASRLAELGRP